VFALDLLRPLMTPRLRPCPSIRCRGTSATPRVSESPYVFMTWGGSFNKSCRTGWSPTGPFPLSPWRVDPAGLPVHSTGLGRLLPTTFSAWSYLHPQDLV